MISYLYKIGFIEKYPTLGVIIGLLFDILFAYSFAKIMGHLVIGFFK